MPTVKTAKAGTCYAAAYDMLLAMPDDAVLVHGYPRLCSDDHLRGRKFGHAWVEREVGGLIWCYDHQRAEPIPAVLYYAVGKIKPDECKRYTKRRALRLSLRTERYGPWGKQPKDALFAEDESG